MDMIFKVFIYKLWKQLIQIKFWKVTLMMKKLQDFPVFLNIQ